MSNNDIMVSMKNGAHFNTNKLLNLIHLMMNNPVKYKLLFNISPVVAWVVAWVVAIVRSVVSEAVAVAVSLVWVRVRAGVWASVVVGPPPKEEGIGSRQA